MTISFNFDYHLFLVGLVVYVFLGAIVSIVVGVSGTEKDTDYGVGEVIGGVIAIAWIAVCAIW